jgi:hypothetical protein
VGSSFAGSSFATLVTRTLPQMLIRSLSAIARSAGTYKTPEDSAPRRHRCYQRVQWFAQNTPEVC